MTIRRIAPWMAVCLLAASPFVAASAHAQYWRPLPLPDGAEYLKLAANRTQPNTLALWYTTAQIADSARHSVLTPWIFSRTTNAGGSWATMDNGQFYYITTSPASSFQSTWGDVSYVGTQITRVIREQGGLDFRTSTLERSIDHAPFRRIAYPDPFTMAGPLDRVYLAENNIAYYLRTREHHVFDSSAFSLVQLRDADTTWSFHPDGIERWHVGPPLVWLGFRLNAQNVFLLGTMEGTLRSADNGESWSAVASGAQLDISRVESVHVHPRSNVPMFAIARRSGGDGRSRLYRSMDQGNLWIEVFADTLITQLAMARSDAGVVMIATQGDLYASSDTGSTWRSVRGNLDRPYGAAGIQSLFIDAGDPHRAYVATARGIHIADNWVAVERLPDVDGASLSFELFPNPSPRHAAVQLRLPAHPSPARLDVHDVLGRLIHTQELAPIPAPHLLVLPPLPHAGMYVVALHSAGIVRTGRLILLP